MQIAPEPAAPELATTDTVLFGSPADTPAPSGTARPAAGADEPAAAGGPDSGPAHGPATRGSGRSPPAAGSPPPLPGGPPTVCGLPGGPPVWGPSCHAARPTGGNGVGVAALVFGLASIPVAFLWGFLGLALAIAAVTLGIIGLVQAGKTDPPGPRGLSIAGLALAGVGILIMIFWVLILVTG